MIVRDIIWTDSLAEKILTKHHVGIEEVEWVLEHKPVVRYLERGHVKGEDLYAALGRTAAGRYLIVFFVLKKGARVLPISARDMEHNEKKRYAREKKKKR
jgi:uncharacterized DUF497 family protein